MPGTQSASDIGGRGRQAGNECAGVGAEQRAGVAFMKSFFPTSFFQLLSVLLLLLNLSLFVAAFYWPTALANVHLTTH